MAHVFHFCRQKIDHTNKTSRFQFFWIKPMQFYSIFFLNRMEQQTYTEGNHWHFFPRSRFSVRLILKLQYFRTYLFTKLYCIIILKNVIWLILASYLKICKLLCVHHLLSDPLHFGHVYRPVGIWKICLSAAWTSCNILMKLYYSYYQHFTTTAYFIICLSIKHLCLSS
jgi:hypothetical protein